ncbi:MAG: single-stranded DNA-binding protein [Chloroflexi bacterium]|nr:single-stranded DNA-binding protein [Chloroflexota bacterium]
MAGTLNKVLIIGHVGRDPEMRYLPNGTPVTSFSVATNRAWTTPENERREETEWHNIVAWNKLAEQCGQYITKGRKVYIEGRLRTRSWEKEGQKHSRTEVVAYTMLLLDSRPRSAAGGDESAAEHEDELSPDDIPF